MRYAEGPSAHGDIHVGAAVPRVWELVTDILLPARFSPELCRAAWLDGAEGPRVGARFEGHNHHRLLGEWRTVSYVTELEATGERRVFAWAVTDADGRYGEPAPDPARPMATWRYALAPEDGGTRLRQSARLGPARSGVSLALDRWPDREERIVAARVEELRAGMEKTLAGIKSLAERGA
ncbi:SRPBCC family protein [Streptomyces sp. WAC08241]|uniref:SRPBCC family protein n=1 Tax=Streptomyces sp. WAC08241 TaxID=2487421 RepID=UPI000F777FC3|nr:SRPBCC family protein [Streptomyces sp. WAC08241]RSS36536.1 SRPBCC family protein [Streptomyces sp. WAC08241]